MKERCILAGRWKGRRLPVHPSAPCRPMLGLQRERLFNWLQPYILGSSCLDLFGGSGALGLEALSRGAAHVLIYENFAEQMNLIRKSWFQSCQNGELKLLCQDVCMALRHPASKPFDIIFLDPPFPANLWAEVESQLVRHQWVHPGSLLAREVPKNYSQSIDPRAWELKKASITPTLKLQLYEKL